MPVGSLDLIAECQRRGMLSKEAAARLIRQREDIIEAAMRKQAALLVEAMRNAPDPDELDKAAGIFDFGRARSAAKKSEGFLSKLKSGGLTGGGKGGGPTGWDDVGLNLTKMLGLAGLTAGASAGIGGILRHRRDKKMQGDIEASYREMYNQNPRLKEIDEQHPGKVEQRFGMLAKFAPSLAAEPAVAGHWIQTSIHQGVISPGEIRTLAETQQRIDEMKETREHGGRLLQRPFQLGNLSQIAAHAVGK